MPRSALVTGACGFTGTHMVELLVNEGWDVTATDLSSDLRKDYYCEAGNLHPVHYGDFLREQGVEYVAADLTDRKSLAPLFERKYDVIFHTASLYDYFAQWDELYKVNVTGTQNIGELAVENGVGRFVHWSTDGVYGESHEMIDETAPHNPPNLYSKSKSEQEKVLWDLRKEKGLKLTVVRPAPVYGPRHRYGVYHILYGMSKMGTGVILSWYPKSKTLMMPSVHVTDLVRAALFVSEKPEAEGEAYNVLSDCIPQPEFLEFIYRALGLDRILRFPVPWVLYELGAKVALWHAKGRDREARARGSRPKLDVPMVEYITHQYWFSNQKIKDLGYEFVYQDSRRGMWQYITWCKERGWL